MNAPMDDLFLLKQAVLEAEAREYQQRALDRMVAEQGPFLIRLETPPTWADTKTALIHHSTLSH